MSGAAFVFWWAVGSVAGLGLIGLLVRLLCAVACLLEHLDDKGVWPFGPR